MYAAWTKDYKNILSGKFRVNCFIRVFFRLHFVCVSGFLKNLKFHILAISIVTCAFQMNLFYSRIVCGLCIVLFCLLGDDLSELSLCLIFLPFSF